jgi:hypothetical protein
MRCVELNNVYAALISSAMSVIAFMLALSARHNVNKALQDMGGGAGLADAARGSVPQLGFSLLLNGVACTAICLSQFDCQSAMKHSCTHSLTSSTSFCVLRVVCFLTFLAEMSFSFIVLIGTVGVFVLDFICRMGSTTVYHAQEVIWEMGNFTATGKDPFDPYSTGNFSDAKAADTPIFSLSKTMQTLDLNGFCPHASLLGGQMALFWVGCVLALVSQALMAIALNGEKERVAVHEQHEEASMGGARGEAMNLLGSANSAAQSGLSGLQSSYNQYRAGAPGH